MTEYSRAPRRGHRDLVPDRPVRVDREPSPWPCAAILALLWLMCLVAPDCWQTTGMQDAAMNAPPDMASDEIQIPAAWVAQEGPAGGANYNWAPLETADYATNSWGNSNNADRLPISTAP